MALWVTFSSAAALVKLRCLAATLKLRKAFKGGRRSTIGNLLVFLTKHMRNDRLRLYPSGAKFQSSAKAIADQPKETVMNQICANEANSRALPAGNNPWTRFVRTIDSGLSTVVDSLLTWQRRHKDRMHLMALDERLLHDIGISLADVEREVSKPFWRP